MKEKFDMQKAREKCENLPVGGGQTIKANILFYKRYYEAGKMLPAALDRIEELENALVEERASHIDLDMEYARLECDSYRGSPDKSRMAAREQLHAEGLI